MRKKRVLMVLGGTHHDFDGFAATFKPVLETAGYAAESTYDLDALIRLNEGRYDAVLLYTCLGTPGEDDVQLYTAEQAEALLRWVREGRAILAFHAATVSSQFNRTLQALLGGVFVSHPSQQFTFTVYPLFCKHPITDGIEAFAVTDEFYMEMHEPSVNIHMIALDRGVAHPMVWSRSEGQGRVVHIAMGHDEKVWNLKPYQRLMLQAVAWLTA
jgi:type 1 glutamine amidotransferase